MNHSLLRTMASTPFSRLLTTWVAGTLLLATVDPANNIGRGVGAVTVRSDIPSLAQVIDQKNFALLQNASSLDGNSVRVMRLLFTPNGSAVACDPPLTFMSH